MEHTRQKAQKNRGMFMIVLVLAVVWLMEPDFWTAGDVCRALFLRFSGGLPQ